MQNGGHKAMPASLQTKTTKAFTRENIGSINSQKVGHPLNSTNVLNLNSRHAQSISHHAESVSRHANAQKGQKIALEKNGKLSKINAILGWNVKDSALDINVSAFLLNANGKVIGDDWFVFYGQKVSPDGSVEYYDSIAGGILADRERISVDFTKLSPSIKRIVFVLTIHEAFERKQNFSFVQDAYIRIMDAANQTELTSFMLDEYYPNVVSMMIGEVYNHNNSWKFNAVGSGVAKDLKGLCSLYGVQVE